jgi:hypothetical protein
MKLQKLSEMNVFPNPVKDFLNIQFKIHSSGLFENSGE